MKSRRKAKAKPQAPEEPEVLGFLVAPRVREALLAYLQTRPVAEVAPLYTAIAASRSVLRPAKSTPPKRAR